MNQPAHRFLFLIRHPPLAGARIRETLDMILTTAAFDQFITLVFLDDGVYQLLAPAAADAAETLLWPSLLKAVELYDFHDILVEEESLGARGLGAADLAIGVGLVSADRVGKLLAEHDRLVVC